MEDITYSTQKERKKLYTKLVKEWADAEGTTQRQIRKIAHDFYALGVADAKNRSVVENGHGIRLGMNVDEDLKELVAQLES